MFLHADSYIVIVEHAGVIIDAAHVNDSGVLNWLSFEFTCYLTLVYLDVGCLGLDSVLEGGLCVGQ